MYRLSLITFGVYFALGNLPRVLPVGPRDSNISITELGLYVICTLTFLAKRKAISVPNEVLAASAIALISCGWGMSTYGPSAAAALYAVRLVMMMISGVVIGQAMFACYADNIERAMLYVLVPFLVNTIIGWVLFFVFPNTAVLLTLLLTFGIKYVGDPHVQRFLSAFLDPNHYASLITLGVALALVCYQQTKKTIYLLTAVFFCVSALFALSRAGTAGLLIVLIVIGLSGLKQRISRWAIVTVHLLPIAALLAFPLYQDILGRMLERFQTNIAVDVSSQERFNSARDAFEILAQHPLLGVGYNYIREYYSDTFFDSSLLSLYVTMGLIGGTLFVLILGRFIQRALRHLWFAEPDHGRLFRNCTIYVSAYLVVAVLFTGETNNLLLIQFWAIPVFSILIYFYQFRPAYELRSVAHQGKIVFPA